MMTGRSNDAAGLAGKRRVTGRVQQGAAVAVWLLAAWASNVHAGVEKRTAAYTYDAAGRLLTEAVEPFNSDLCLVTVYEYDAYGHQKSSRQRNCNGSAIPGVGSEAAAPTGPAAFDGGPGTLQQVALPGTAGTTERRITTTNGLGHASMQVLDSRFGGVKTVTDVNNLVSRKLYDSLGRLTLEQGPDGNGRRYIYEYCTAAGGATVCPDTGSAASAYMVTSYAATGVNVDTGAGMQSGPYTRTYHDMFHRVIRVESQGWNGAGVAKTIYQTTLFDTLGNVSSKSSPYFVGEATQWTLYSTDVLGRVYREDRPDGGRLDVVYDGLKTTRQLKVLTAATTYSTQTTQSTIEHHNVLGQVVRIDDSAGKALTRTYTPWGDLQTTVDPAGNTVRMEYNLLGRRTRLVDPDLGTWTYDYDAAGRMVKQTDAKGQSVPNWYTTFEYDVLGRLKRRVEPSQESRWYYDTQYADGSACSTAKGALCETVTLIPLTGATDSSRRYSYDNLGRSTSTTVSAPVAGGTGVYRTDLSYDAVGRVATRAYPAGPTDQRLSLTYEYSSLGFILSVKDTETGYAYWTPNQYDPSGRLIQQTYGNQVVTTRQYDAMGRIKSIQAGSGNAVQNYGLGYDYAGNLRSRSDTQATAILTYQYDYDNLNRLRSETRSGGALASPQTITWAYDDIGNITSRSDVGTYSYPAGGAARPHAVSSVSGNVNGVANPTYAYDANGNILSGGGRTATWTSFNLPETVTRGVNQLAWGYDSDHERLREQWLVNGAVARSTIYINAAAGAGLFYEEETMADGVRKRRHYISGGDGTVALLTRQQGVADQLRYWHKDHLGSTSVVTDAAQAVVERMAYEPFGKRRVADNTTDTLGTLTAVSTDRGYTEHEMLDEVGLIHMNGRIYDPAISRFLSADDRIPNPLNLQSYNRYAYVANNPLGATDPTGHEPWESSGKGNTYYVSNGDGTTWNTYTGADGSSSYSGYTPYTYSAGSYGTPVSPSELLPIPQIYSSDKTDWFEEYKARQRAEKDVAPKVGSRLLQPGESIRGNLFFGGAGMDGAYIKDMVRAFGNKGIALTPVDREKWSGGTLLDASVGVDIYRDGKFPMQVLLDNFHQTGPQFNLVGYSYGSVAAAQVAINYAEAGTPVDNLVLIGSPIGEKFLNRLQSTPNIRNVVVINLTDQGDPIRAGMTRNDLLLSAPILAKQMVESSGHFYYAPSSAEGQARRDALAAHLHSSGVR